MTRARRTRSILALLCALGTLGAGGCGTSISVVTQGQPDGPVIKIGVPVDEPSMGWLHNNTHQGFDVDVANYVADYLGYGEHQIEYVAANAASAGRLLADGAIEMAFVAMPVNPGDDGPLFAGPYLASANGVMVRDDERDTTGSPASLDGKTVCTVPGTDAQAALADVAKGARVREEPGYDRCVSALLTDEVDAVVAGRPILDGLAEETGHEYVHVADASFGVQSYGVAVAKGSTTLAEQVDDALRQMVKDGSWDAAVRDLEAFGGYRADRELCAKRMQSVTDPARGSQQ